MPSPRSLYLLILLASTILTAAARAQCPGVWSTFDGGRGLVGGPGPTAMVEWDPDGLGPLPSQLVVAGNFTRAGTLNAQNLAQWDGAHWNANILPAPPSILAMTVFNGQLVVAGNFTPTTGGPANRIAAWDGSAWQPLGLGLNNQCNALAVYNGELIAGGTFTTAGGAPVPSLAKWNGSTWAPLPGSRGGASGIVYALKSLQGHLIVGGTGLLPSNQGNTDVIAWDGSVWTSFPPGVGWGQNNGLSVRSISEYNGQIVVGQAVGSASIAPLHTFDGASWQNIGTFPTGFFQPATVSSLEVYDGDLYARAATSRASSPARTSATWPAGTAPDGATSGMSAITRRWSRRSPSTPAGSWWAR